MTQSKDSLAPGLIFKDSMTALALEILGQGELVISWHLAHSRFCHHG